MSTDTTCESHTKEDEAVCQNALLVHIPKELSVDQRELRGELKFGIQKNGMIAVSQVGALHPAAKYYCVQRSLVSPELPSWHVFHTGKSGRTGLMRYTSWCRRGTDQIMLVTPYPTDLDVRTLNEELAGDRVSADKLICILKDLSDGVFFLDNDGLSCTLSPADIVLVASKDAHTAKILYKDLRGVTICREGRQVPFSDWPLDLLSNPSQHVHYSALFKQWGLLMDVLSVYAESREFSRELVSLLGKLRKVDYNGSPSKWLSGVRLHIQTYMNSDRVARVK